MTIKLDESIQGIWLVMSDEGPWVLTVSKGEDGRIYLQQYMNGVAREKPKAVEEKSLGEVLSRIRKTVQVLMEHENTDKGWEAIRGIRTLDEYIEELKRLPGFREQKRGEV